MSRRVVELDEFTSPVDGMIICQRRKSIGVKGKRLLCRNDDVSLKGIAFEDSGDVMLDSFFSDGKKELDVRRISFSNEEELNELIVKLINKVNRLINYYLIGLNNKANGYGSLFNLINTSNRKKFNIRDLKDISDISIKFSIVKYLVNHFKISNKRTFVLWDSLFGSSRELPKYPSKNDNKGILTEIVRPNTLKVNNGIVLTHLGISAVFPDPLYQESNSRGEPESGIILHCLHFGLRCLGGVRDNTLYLNKGDKVDLYIPCELYRGTALQRALKLVYLGQIDLYEALMTLPDDVEKLAKDSSRVLESLIK